MLESFIFNNPTWTPSIGSLVSNFGQVARIVEIRSNGDFVLREIGKRSKWVADPAKCDPVI